ncbi:MAG: M81 family metallopeptidase [bacterium]|nr:M81 family metallopeptidase [bacterium]
MKWIVGSFSHETNTFSTVPTDLDAFQAQTYHVGAEIADRSAGTKTPIGGFIDVAQERGDELVFTVSAHATPSGLVTQEAYETIGAQLLEGIEANPDADGILLALHGAMVAEGIDDGEGELLRRIREVVGDEMPVVLDLHSHITEEMVGAADVLIGYQKYPHTDTYERGVEAARLIEQIVKGDVRPVSALQKPRMIPPCGTCHTQGGLYKELWEEALRADRPGEILTTSLFAGFPYADIPPMGFAVLVYARGDEGIAKAEADRLATMAWDRREAFLYTPTSVSDAVSQALAVDGGPVVIADISDNPGGGGSNDGVEILRELLHQGVRDAAVATIYDPEVVTQAVEAGVGASIRSPLGAKTDVLHGASIEIEGRVRLLFDGDFQYKGPMTQGAWGSIGTSAVVDVQGVRVIVCSKRLQSRDPEVFRAAGIEPLAQKILVVKSAVHFRAAFEPLAAEVIVADAPGLTSLDMSLFDFKRITRPMFPLDKDVV